MRSTLFSLLCSLSLAASPAVAAAAAQRALPTPVAGATEAAGERIALWPAGHVPGESTTVRGLHVVERSNDPSRPDRYVDQVDAPWLLVHAPTRPNGKALLVIPGGGYQRVVIDKEGTELVPQWVERAGYTLFVLRYRLPEPGRDRQAALADAQRAMRVVRAAAASRGLDAQDIAVMGFSAGGHIAARLATGFDSPVYPAADAADRLSARPSRAVLVYPVIDMGPQAHGGSRQRLIGPEADATTVRRYSMQDQVRADMPPTLLLHAADDRVVSVDNSLLMARALAAAGVEHELHVFAHGGHGFGMRAAGGATTALWPDITQRWLQTQPQTQEGHP